ncbi:ArsR/SmtB family transcription factor [Tabrizicola oligotrophica]|uniref:Helix-turn-helix transcriptional regulator n=1 Tax=Tabrizicola oligotrophica TaxID=2710650 RepID=A0A6M0QWF4_9RHOB|nr:metalloregulator ArsR/SmtB family transcription factor [Tabrizicola oligotrophica]NEY91311.1 helix-turn-helix transcriptional regulator [Tabrizicola oligotrophica]
MAKHDPALDLIFQALSDPTRRAMLARLGQGAAPVSELARPTGLALPTVMKHLGVLEGAGLIATEKSGRARLCHARPETLSLATDWLAEQRSLWEGRLDRFEAYVQTLMPKPSTPETRDEW